ncbi:MAG: hypothetical protein IID03_12880 [Candidatus Dadabacteria bacterium]|nr:hypothetical protein [Candidatus Dadabacteria bacterium]
MARKFNISQLKSKLNQIKTKQKAAIRKIESDVNRAVNKHKQEVRQYNQKVRQHNDKVRANKQKLITALHTFQNHSYSPITTVRYLVEYRQSVSVLNTSYERLESYITPQQDSHDCRLLLDLPEQENKNSLMLYNSLSGYDEDDGQTEYDLKRTAIEELLYKASPEYCNRWKGAIFALNPGNPDAARHFCTSAREICIGILDIHAPDYEVRAFAGCELSQEGRPTRRSKINYLLDRKSIRAEPFKTFVDEDLKNVLQLFSELNSGTHGNAGKFGIPQLLKLKKRVEDSIVFISSIAS